MTKCCLYLSSLQHFTLMIDHHPLIPIPNKYTLDTIKNPRLQCIKQKVAPYVSTAVWHAGKQLCIPDDLSCSQTSCPTPEDEDDCTILTAHVRCIVASTATSIDDRARGSILVDGKRPYRNSALLHLRMNTTAASSSMDPMAFPPTAINSIPPAHLYWKPWDNLYEDVELVLYRALHKHTLACLCDSLQVF